MDSYYYLKPGFDSKKLTIAQLTSILSFHNVKLPGTSQRKYVYLELFDNEIMANASKLLAELNNIEPSDAGIQIVNNAGAEPNHGKHASTRDSSPARKRIKPTDEIIPLTPKIQSIKAPTLDKFFISPSLSGIRSRIKTRVAELKEFWDSQSQNPESPKLLESTESLEESDDCISESLSDEYRVKSKISKDVEFKMINMAQYMTFIITISALCLGLFLTRPELFSYRAIEELSLASYESMAPYLDLLSNLKSFDFYKVIIRSIMQMVSPSVFLIMEKISAFIEYMMEFISGLDPVFMYSVGGLCMIIAFGMNE